MAIGEWRRGPAIGRGSTARVSAAVASPSGIVFAVKYADLSLSAPLQREQGILSSLRHHPNIVSYLGFEVAAGVYNLFLEYAPLGSLFDCIEDRGGRLEEPEIRSYAGDLLRGLAHLHAAGVSHRDVKSRNVLVFPGGRAKLADFGCAWRTAAPPAPVAGTPMYMAPEAARGEAQGLPADLWALGCTVIEMATGRPPWPDVADPVAALHRAGFTGAVPDCPGWLSADAIDFVGKCLKRDPKDRWTAEQLLRHPFVAKARCMPENASAPAEQIWVSPKSTLEQSMWDSEEEEYNFDSPEERLRRLAGIASPAIDWEIDDNWITVRSDEMQSPAATAEDNDEPAIAATDNLDLSASRGPEPSFLDSIPVPDDRNDPFPVESTNQIVDHGVDPPVFVLNNNSKKIQFFSSNSPQFNHFFFFSEFFRANRESIFRRAS